MIQRMIEGTARSQLSTYHRQSLAPPKHSPQNPRVEALHPFLKTSGVAAWLVLSVAIFGGGCATTGDRSISGHILGKATVGPITEASPVQNARIQLRVVEPASKRPEEGPRFKLPHGIDALTNLRGVAVTTADGVYAFESLFTPWVDDEEHPLLQGWLYEVEIVAPGYYIFRESFVYEGETVQLRDWTLEKKPRDVHDSTGGVLENTHLMRESVGKRFE